jgi:hypothetical protein
MDRLAELKRGVAAPSDVEVDMMETNKGAKIDMSLFHVPFEETQ